MTCNRQNFLSFWTVLFCYHSEKFLSSKNDPPENDQRWKHRIEGGKKRLTQEVNFLERESKAELRLKKKCNLRQLNE